MTDASLRNIFSRFQNLNLIFLIRDLELGLVARKEWFDRDESTMCPIAHGCQLHGIMAGFRLSQAAHDLKINSWEVVEDFVRWWDRGLSFSTDESATRQLLSVLRSILHERMSDADAVQRVTGRPTSEFTWNKTDYSARKKAQEFSRETAPAI